MENNTKKPNTVKKKKSLYDYIITVSSRGLNRFFMLLVSILIARLLGVEEFGIYSLFFGVFILIFQTQTGVNIAYVRFVKASPDLNKNIILKLSLLYQLIFLITLLIFGWFLSSWLIELLKIDDPFVLFYGFVTGGLIGIYSIWFGVFQEKGNFIKLGILSLLFNFLLLLLIATLLALDRSISLNLIINLYVALTILLSSISFIFIIKKCLYFEFNRALFNDFSKMIMLNMSVTLFYFLYRYVDVYFIQYYLTIEDVGVYSAAMKTSMLLNILAGALPTILLPKAIEAIKSKKCFFLYINKSYQLVSLIILFFALFYIVSPLFLVVLFGDEFSDAEIILKWLIIGWGVNVLYLPIAQIFYAFNKVQLRLLVELVKLISAIIAFIYLIPQNGALGAAYGLLIAISIAFVLGSFIIFFLFHKNLILNTH